ncbi:hypothetical protein HKD37_19G055101 [Glycine soja]
MVATTPQPRINLESLFDFNGNNNHKFRFIVDDNNHRFRFIIVECYVSNEKSRRTPCRQNLPLNFSPLHVSERLTATLILQRAPVVRVGGGNADEVLCVKDAVDGTASCHWMCEFLNSFHRGHALFCCFSLHPRPGVDLDLEFLIQDCSSKCELDPPSILWHWHVPNLGSL